MESSEIQIVTNNFFYQINVFVNGPLLTLKLIFLQKLYYVKKLRTCINMQKIRQLKLIYLQNMQSDKNDESDNLKNLINP